jgi:hypothetical protein
MITKERTMWFTSPLGTIGIVCGTNEVGEKKAYIGSVAGIDPNEIDDVAKRGAKLIPSHAKILDDFFGLESNRNRRKSDLLVRALRELEHAETKTDNAEDISNLRELIADIKKETLE